jgi:hypothetical protein
MKRHVITKNEYHDYYNTYLEKVPDSISLHEGFKTGKDEVLQFFRSIPIEKQNFAYAEGKWTIKEVFQHLIDTERIFLYRCFRLGRKDNSALAGFNQDDYIMTSNANSKSITLLLEEFTTTRDSFMVLLKTLKETDLEFIGTASNAPISPRALAFINLGHYLWHIDIIKERYL